MNYKFSNKRISGILTVLPENEVKFVDEMKNFDFPVAKSLKLQKIMGFEKHRIVDSEVCVSDLAVFGLQHLIDHGVLTKEDIDALIVITQTPDYLIPATSNIIQGRLNLKNDTFCLDINQGCAGFIIGLIQSFMMLEQDSIKKVVLINGDVLSRKVSKKDRNSWPLIGDGVSITVVEKETKDSLIYANLKMDGTRHEALIIPAGGMKLPSSPETGILEDVGDNNFRSKDNLKMDGAAVFNFVQTEVPPMVTDLLEYSGVGKDDIEYYLFHQPNKFMLEKLADKLKVPYEKMPNNIVSQFGNSSGASIPTNITFNLGESLKNQSMLVCLAGFGVGLTWASMLINLGNLNFCKIINY